MRGLEQRVRQAISTCNGKRQALWGEANILDAFSQGEGPRITKSQIAEAARLVGTLNELVEMMENGEELGLEEQVEALLAEEPAKVLIVESYQAMTSEPKGKEVKKLDF